MNSVRKSWIGLAVAVCAVCSSATAYARERRQYVGSGNWATAANWIDPDDGVPNGVEPVRADRVNLYDANSTVTITNVGEEAGSLYLVQSAGSSRTLMLRILSGSLLVDYDDSSDMIPSERDTVYLGQNTPEASNNKCVIDHQGGAVSMIILWTGTASTTRGEYYISEVDPGIPTTFSVSDLNIGGYGVFKVTGSGIDTLSVGSGGIEVVNTTGYVQFVADADGVRKIDVSAAGTVTLRGSLDVDLSALAVSPERIVLIDNAGTDAISGTFSVNAPEGTVYAAGTGRKYALTYASDAAGDGNANDVALELLPFTGTLLSVH